MSKKDKKNTKNVKKMVLVLKKSIK